MASLAPAEKAPTGKPLKVGSPHDPAEREADRIADILTAPEEPAMPVCTACVAGGAPCAACGGGDGGVLRRSPLGAAAPPALAPPAVARGLAATGTPLPDRLRAKFEQRLGTDLSSVRLHAGPDAARAAASVNARAFALDRVIMLGAGALDTGSAAGEWLLAHEVAHTVERGDAQVLRRNGPDPRPVAAPPTTAPPSSATMTPGASGDPLAPYPGLLLSLTEPEYERLRVGAAVTLPLRRLLHRDATSLVAEGGFAEAVAAALQAGVGVGPLLINETTRRFMEQHYGAETPVTLTVAALPGPLAGVAVTFRVEGSEIDSSDGWLHLADLNRASGDRLSVIGGDVLAEAAAMARPVGTLLAARQAAAELGEVAGALVTAPRDYGLNEVTELAAGVGALRGEAEQGGGAGAAPPSVAAALAEQVPALRLIEAQLGQGAAAIRAVTAANGCQTGEEVARGVDRMAAEANAQGTWGGTFVANSLYRSAAQLRFAESLVNLVSGDALGDHDRACLAFRAGRISLSARDRIQRHAMLRAVVAVGVSIAAGALGGWLGTVGGRLVFGAGGRLATTLLAGGLGGGLGGVGFVGAQDLYSSGARALNTDPYVTPYLAAQRHGPSDYLLAFGAGAALGTALGGASYALRGPVPPTGLGAGAADGAAAPGVAAEAAAQGGAAPLLLDAAGRPIGGGGGAPPRGIRLSLPGGGGPGGNGPVTLFTPEEGAGAAVAALDGPSREAVLSGRVILRDLSGRRLRVTEAPGGGLRAEVAEATSLLGEPRLLGPDGLPVRQQVTPRPILVDAQGRPLAAPQGGGEGPLIVDLQAGTPGFLDDVVTRTPDARGIGVERGNWLLAYQGIHPTNPDDLAQALMIARNQPVWPDTPAWATRPEAAPHMLPWEMDPAATLFPREGRVTMTDQSFFPALGGNGGGGGQRLIPFGLGDIPAQGSGLPAFLATPQPELPGLADQVFLRRTFGLGLADEVQTRAMGQQVNAMLRQGGFVEIRPTRATDFRVQGPGQAAGPDQAALLAQEIEGAAVYRVRGADVRTFQQTGRYPPGAGPIEQEMIREAARDTEGLGAGAYRTVVRIYRGGAGGPAPAAGTGTGGGGG